MVIELTRKTNVIIIPWYQLGLDGSAGEKGRNRVEDFHDGVNCGAVVDPDVVHNTDIMGQGTRQ
jgi:hypothetical protein